jgi:hypothetical protein
MNPHDLQGKKYIFEDGAEIFVKQVKDVDAERGSVQVTYLVSTSPRSIPRQLILSWAEFQDHYGHLFKE